MQRKQAHHCARKVVLGFTADGPQSNATWTDGPTCSGKLPIKLESRTGGVVGLSAFVSLKESRYSRLQRKAFTPDTPFNGVQGSMFWAARTPRPCFDRQSTGSRYQSEPARLIRSLKTRPCPIRPMIDLSHKRHRRHDGHPCARTVVKSANLHPRPSNYETECATQSWPRIAQPFRLCES